MRRTLVALALSVFVVTGTGVVSPSRAAADTDVCAGTFDLMLSAPLFYPVGTPTTAGFSASTTAGVCLAKVSLSMGGVVTGWCGLFTGAGVTTNGHRFTMVSAGATVVFTGELEGVGTGTPPASIDKCIAGVTQASFAMAGIKRHCTVVKNKTTTVVTPVVVHAKLCA